MRVILYSLPGSVCQGCRLTKKKMDELGIVYEEIPLDRNRATLEHVHALGHKTAPVVEVEMGEATWSWSGYRPGHLTKLAEEIIAT
jgi:glutaredoxin-like protein NrdH